MTSQNSMHRLSKHDPLGFRNILAYEIPLSNCSPCTGHRKRICSIPYPFSVSLPSDLLIASSFLPSSPFEGSGALPAEALPAQPSWLRAPSRSPRGVGAALAVCPGHLPAKLPCSNPAWLHTAVPPTGDRCRGFALSDWG